MLRDSQSLRRIFNAANPSMTKSKMVRWILLLGCYLFWSILIVLIILKILKLNDGFFVYTLDDAYIHLSLAENIMQGHYGVNLGEFSAPSSSILWPFLLAPFARFEIVPLVINILVGVVTIGVYAKVLQYAFFATRHTFHLFLSSILILLLTLSTNLIGLVFTGMEHSLQVLIVGLIAWGLIMASRENSAQPWLYIAVGLAPLVRYENLAVSAAALLFLVLNKHFKKSLLTLAFIAVSLGGYSLFLLANGQTILPASVLVKSSVVTDGFLHTFFNNFLYNLTTWFGVLSIIVIALLAGLILFGKMDLNRRRLAYITILPVVLHLLAGRVGWYRYEIYMLAFMSLLTIYLVGSLISPRLDRPGTMVQWAAVTVVMSIFILFSNFPYVMLLAYVPESSNNVYNQHFQMHRFVTEFHKGPVAANDIGYLTYKNDDYVLDLYSLTSLEAYHYRMAGEPENWMDVLCNAHDIDLVMIYEDWYPDIPEKWIKVGDMIYHGHKITIANPTVAFFATSQTGRDEIEQDLKEFIPTLPENTTFVFTP